VAARVKLQQGDLLAIPYYRKRSIYGRVVQIDQPDTPSTAVRGLYLEVLDRDVTQGDDLAEVVRAKTLLGPLFTIVNELRKGHWKVVGHAPYTKPPKLPHFLWGTGIVDYFGKRIEDTRANRARAIILSSSPPAWVEYAARALRGKGKWSVDYDSFLPSTGDSRRSIRKPKPSDRKR
jgi:hypothetical protein